MRIAVCDVLEEILKRQDENEAEGFSDIIKWHFLLYFSRYVEIVEKNADVEGDFEIMKFEYERNWMSGSFDFNVCRCEFSHTLLSQEQTLKSRILNIKENLVQELKEWQKQGVENSKNHSFACQHIMSAFEQRGNKCSSTQVQQVCLGRHHHGGSGRRMVIPFQFRPGRVTATRRYENGMYQLEITFPPNFPDCMPRPRFQTQMFHPQHGGHQGLCCCVFAASSRTGHQNVQAILSDIHSLLKNPPSPDPRTWVNKKAADMYFGGDQEEFKRTVRRYAQRSMEQSKTINLRCTGCNFVGRRFMTEVWNRLPQIVIFTHSDFPQYSSMLCPRIFFFAFLYVIDALESV
eukprot:768533-Hanusia_phi.AAC.2